ncbi:hypothetical protein TSUD_16680 [Trifolium subterraneum]|uniref:Uncharacterized protein n=1 Tax=Trifolium subterraneum TaxID=3900 RepID=A0A2Z6MQU0_TRISU|nr:hypothetical protein TSUD_16680 [Trifolium subterraneum]
MASDSSWLVHMEVMLGSLDHIEVQSCSICNVLEELRGLKEKAYKPKCISIGPLHRGATSYLELMEESKWQYMRESLERQGIIPEQNRTSEGAERMDSSYSEICDRLNVYKGKKATKAFRLRLIVWHQCRRIFDVVLYYCQNWYKILKRDHIPTVWKLIGVMAAILLLILTIMQTYYSSRG